MLSEKLDIDRGENKPSYEETDACSGEKDPDVVDTDGENSADDTDHYWDSDYSVRYPGLMEVVRGEGENDEIGEGAAYNKTDEEENNFDESVTCVCGKGRERNEWRRGEKKDKV